jgi:hypothetical protein
VEIFIIDLVSTKDGLYNVFICVLLQHGWITIWCTNNIGISNSLIKQYYWYIKLWSAHGAINFWSNLLQEICLVLRIKKTQTTISRHNQMIWLKGQSFCVWLSKELEWICTFGNDGLQSSVHESAENIPALMTFRREITLPIDLIFGDPEKKPSEKQK